MFTIRFQTCHWLKFRIFWVYLDASSREGGRWRSQCWAPQPSPAPSLNLPIQVTSNTLTHHPASAWHPTPTQTPVLTPDLSVRESLAQRELDIDNQAAQSVICWYKFSARPLIFNYKVLHYKEQLSQQRHAGHPLSVSAPWCPTS